MEAISPTWQTGSHRPRAVADYVACLVHIYPTGASMGARYVLGDDPLTLGRCDDCDIRHQDHSVSRHHARVEPCVSGYRAVDLQSTNGTFVNEQPVERALLNDGDYLRVGNCIYRFLSGDNVEAGYHEEIYRLTIIDALTGIHNKRYFLEFLERELVRSQRHERPLALLMFDIDHFKAINDQFGHLCGDTALRALAGCLKQEVRQDDLFARYGGEEFAVVLTETTREGALLIAERMRQLAAEHPFRHEGKPFSVTISLGATATRGEAPLTSEEFIHRADANLYEAKHLGRDRVVG